MICHIFLLGDYLIAKESEAWLAYRDRPVARPIAIADYLSRGGKPAFCRAAAICSADSDVSTSTRRVAGSVLNRRISIKSQNRLFYRTGAAAAGHVINMELHSELLLCGNCCQSGPCQCWKVKRNLRTYRRFASPWRRGRRNTAPVRASGSLSSGCPSVCRMGQSGSASPAQQ